MDVTLLVGTDRWRREHPRSRAAVVLYRNLTTAGSALFERMKRDLETELRNRWSDVGKRDLLNTSPLDAYQRYDQRFGQNYHVAMQILSIAQKGKAIPDRNLLIEAMFMTELKTGVLASAQDADLIQFPITVDSASGDETYIRYDGVEERCKAGDQLMRDAAGEILTSIAQGPTASGLVGEQTSAVAYCFYFPDGVTDEVIADSLEYLDQCVCSFATAASRIGPQIVTA